MVSDLPRMFVISREAPPKCGNRSTVPQVPALVDAAVGSQRCGATLAHRPVTEAAQDASTRLPAAVRPRVVAQFISPDFLEIDRADFAGFVHRCCRCLRARPSWAVSAFANGSNRPEADIADAGSGFLVYTFFATGFGPWRRSATGQKRT